MEGLGTDLVLLSKLLNPPKSGNESDDEEDRKQSKSKYLSPSDVCEIKAEKKPNEAETRKPEKVETENIEEYFKEETDSNPQNDWKRTPKWEVSYRQSVTPSDVFLQMGGKTPTTASCENMIMKIHLPGESRQNIDLKVLRTNLEVNSAKFYLSIPLPQPVDPQLGNAQYDAESEDLVVTLVMDREFDFVNF
ncbi:PREDICTED: protein PIH1D3 [Nicrophorus vespilloides]|uniref:Protein PIH1D3 n=1 Tax=Nicrophorus vespilloides TaxID=110193 RepID=A0ABM1N7Y4_NICVS|nr:PREDICTED: protein PIH1D3 [Nicrophorus vespilloides]